MELLPSLRPSSASSGFFSEDCPGFILHPSSSQPLTSFFIPASTMITSMVAFGVQCFLSFKLSILEAFQRVQDESNLSRLTSSMFALQLVKKEKINCSNLLILIQGWKHFTWSTLFNLLLFWIFCFAFWITVFLWYELISIYCHFHMPFPSSSSLTLLMQPWLWSPICTQFGASGPWSCSSSSSLAHSPSSFVTATSKWFAETLWTIRASREPRSSSNSYRSSTRSCVWAPSDQTAWFTRACFKTLI